MRRGALVPLAAAILALAGVYAATVLAGGSKPAIGTITTTNNAHNKVTICHATGSKTNPYVVITPRPELDRGGAGDLQQRLQGAEAWSDDRLDSRADDDRDHDGTGDDGAHHRTRPDPDRHGDESDSDRHHEERRQGRQGRPQEGH